jgi:hypothetical protein
MSNMDAWQKEPGPRVEGSRPLDHSKVQAPCIVRIPSGGYRLFYTAVGPGKPYPACQGYILSAVSEDGLRFRPEPGIRVAPQPPLPHACLRALAASVTPRTEGGWRMYFEARGPANRPTVICSAVSADLLQWEYEEGIRFQTSGGAGAPRYLPLPDGRGRLTCWGCERGPGECPETAKSVVSAVTSDGLHFEREPGVRLPVNQSECEVSISAAEVVAPAAAGDPWTMFYSAWQDPPAGTEVPVHPSHDPQAVEKGLSADFAAASIAADMAGYRSRIFMAVSTDGLTWGRGKCVIEGAGYGGAGEDAVHAEDMSLIRIEDGRYRMYYAACDAQGNWCVVSAVTA